MLNYFLLCRMKARVKAIWNEASRKSDPVVCKSEVYLNFFIYLIYVCQSGHVIRRLSSLEFIYLKFITWVYHLSLSIWTSSVIVSNPSYMCWLNLSPVPGIICMCKWCTPMHAVAYVICITVMRCVILRSWYIVWLHNYLVHVIGWW
jgi:hypothetical protein